VPSPPIPPTTRTRPSWRRTAACNPRAKAIDPVALQVRVDGSNISALETEPLGADPRLQPSPWLTPPATTTRPSASNVAVWNWRATLMSGTAVHNPVAGSNSSAEAITPDAPAPPVTRTFPLLSKVAVWPYLAVARLPVVEACPTLTGVTTMSDEAIATVTSSARALPPPASLFDVESVSQVRSAYRLTCLPRT